MFNHTRYCILLILVGSCSKNVVDIKQPPSCVHEIVYANTGGIYEYFKDVFIENQEECKNILEVAKIDCGLEENIFAIRKSKRKDTVYNKKKKMHNDSDIHILMVEVWCKSGKDSVCYAS